MYIEVIRLFVGWIILCLPVYLILGKFKFKTFEKIIFAFFISYGMVSLLVYWIGKLVGLWVGIILSVALLFLVVIFWRVKNGTTA